MMIMNKLVNRERKKSLLVGVFEAIDDRNIFIYIYSHLSIFLFYLIYMPFFTKKKKIKANNH